jgi:probable F420-dependent oxidoreductase
MAVGIGVTLGTLGIWSSSSVWAAADAAQAAAELEEAGYGTLWLGGAQGDLRLVEELLGATERLVVATGIVNIWAIPAGQLAANFHRVTGRYPGRFLLGLGASHGPQVEALGRAYVRPVRELERYLDVLDAAPQPVPADQRVLAALGPRALALAARRSAGAHPYLVTPEHTAQARREMGSGVLLAPEQKVVLEPDPARGRAIARDHLRYYLTLPNYVHSFRRLGFGDADFGDGGSDRLVDALYARGVAGAVERVREHRDAGADHVALQAVTPGSGPGSRTATLPRAEWRELAAALG